MRPNERTFEEWYTFYFDTKPKSDDWYEALDGMRLTAVCSEDWSEYARILEYDGFPSNHPEVIIATNGILMAPLRTEAVIQRKESFAETILRMLGWPRVTIVA